MFNQTINKIFFASDQITMIRLGQFGADKESIKKTIKESHEILYSRTTKEDKIEKKLEESIKAMETKCEEIIGKNN